MITVQKKNPEIFMRWNSFERKQLDIFFFLFILMRLNFFISTFSRTVVLAKYCVFRAGSVKLGFSSGESNTDGYNYYT